MPAIDSPKIPKNLSHFTLCATSTANVKQAGCCTYAHQQWCAVYFSTSLRDIFAERMLSFILIFVQNLSPLHEASEGADFSKRDPDPVGVAGTWPKFWQGYQWCASLAPATPQMKVTPEQKNRTCFLCIRLF